VILIIIIIIIIIVWLVLERTLLCTLIENTSVEMFPVAHQANAV